MLPGLAPLQCDEVGELRYAKKLITLQFSVFVWPLANFKTLKKSQEPETSVGEDLFGVNFAL